MVKKRDYTVRLDQLFQGPLDLLLHLVREQEVEIHEIEISSILEGYMQYLETLDQLDIEYAGDFLVMAATLMAIKSRSLLPHEELNLEEELDPRDELIQRLLEYRRFKAAADELEEGFHERGRQTERGFKKELHDGPQEREYDLGELTVWDMLATFSRLMRETLANRTHRVAGDPRPLRFYVDSVISRLRSAGSSTLRGLMTQLEDVPQKEALIGSFCALLELVKMQVVDLEIVEGDREDIRITIRAEHEADAEELIRSSTLDEELPPEEKGETEEPAESGPAAQDGSAIDGELEELDDAEVQPKSPPTAFSEEPGKDSGADGIEKGAGELESAPVPAEKADPRG